MTAQPMVTPDQMSPEFLLNLMREKENGELGSWAAKEFKSMKDLRIEVERQWYQNLAFYFGKHYLTPLINRGSNQIVFNQPKAPPWRVRLVVNRVRPIVRTEIAKLTAQRPTVYVVPASGEEDDKAASRAAEQIWNSAYRDIGVHKVLRRTLWWGAILGNGFCKEYWDQSAGDAATTPDGETVYPGEVKMEVVSPFYIFISDLMCEDIEDQPYVFHSTIKTKEYVKRTFGIDVTSTSKPDELINTQFMNIIGEPTTKKDGVLIHEVWIKPWGHKFFPQGGMLTVVDGKVVQRQDVFPYEHGQYPFAKYDGVQTGKFYADSVISDLIPLQKELNRTRSQIIESKNMMAKPQLMSPKGSIQARKVSSEPGQVIEYTPGMNPPTPLPLQALPNYVLQEVDRLVQDMDDVSGQHEISRGQNPSQVTATSALTYLQEQDESKLASSVASVEEFIEKIARLYLKYVVYFWDLPRTVRVVGRDKIVDAAAWKGSDLKGNTDIRVEAGSAIPLGKMQKQAFLLDLFKLGAIDPSLLFELLEMNDLQDANAEFLVDKQQATRENLLMMEQGAQMDPQQMQPSEDPMTGQMVGPQVPIMFLPQTFDNHEAHVHFHNQYRKSQEFFTAPQVVKELFEYHVSLHQAALLGGMMPTATSPDGQPQGTVPPEGQQQEKDEGEPGEPSPPGGETDSPSNTQPPEQGN